MESVAVVLYEEIKDNPTEKCIIKGHKLLNEFNKIFQQFIKETELHLKFNEEKLELMYVMPECIHQFLEGTKAQTVFKSIYMREK